MVIKENLQPSYVLIHKQCLNTAHTISTNNEI